MPAGARLKYAPISRNTPSSSSKAWTDVQQAVAGEQGEGGPQRDRRRALLRARLSREHAAICPSYLGVRASSPSRSSDPLREPDQLRIVPFLFANEADYDKIAQGDQSRSRTCGRRSGKDEAQGAQRHEGVRLRGHPLLTGRQIDIILAGGRLAYTRRRVVLTRRRSRTVRGSPETGLPIYYAPYLPGTPVSASRGTLSSPREVAAFHAARMRSSAPSPRRRGGRGTACTGRGSASCRGWRGGRSPRSPGPSRGRPGGVPPGADAADQFQVQRPPALTLRAV